LGDGFTVLVDETHAAQAEDDAGPIVAALKHRVIDLDVQVRELVVDRRLDGRDKAGKRDGSLRQTPVAEDDGDQAHDQDASEDLTAQMGAARRQFGELNLNRRGDALHQLPPLGRQSAKGPATLGGQLRQGP